MKRLCAVLAMTVLWLILTINALGAAPSRSAASEPQLAVTPSDFTILTPINTATIYTRALLIANATAGTTLTWSIAISAELPLSVTAQPLTGTNASTVSVQIEVNPIETTGVYTALLIITAEPTTTLDAPITTPVRVVAAESISQTYLPLITRNYAPPLSPPVAPSAGLAFVSSASYGHSELRYQFAKAISGTLNRWPMYWHEIESQAATQPRVYNWAAADSNIAADLNHGLTVLPILMFTPRGLETTACSLASIPKVGDGLRARLDQSMGQKPAAPPPCVTTPPQGLYNSVFSDGTDTPGPGKSINPDNRWAYFVNAAVNRYRPGGTLAQQQGWAAERGVRFWEIWNEPDLDTFFTGTITDYARLLKVGYLSARTADPQAQIVLGGMVHWQKSNWFVSLLNLIKTDPTAVANHYFMDKVAVHNYFWAWQTFGYLYPDRVQLDNHGLQDVELWLTETGVPVCGEGSFPACTDPLNRWYRASPDEQAAYLIQSATYAAWLKNESYVWFQLFDDCGNQCGVDAYGLVRNDNTTRLSYQTYPMIFGQLTDAQPYWRDRRTVTATNFISGNQEIIAFKRPATSERVVVMWTRYYTNDMVYLAATGPSARLYFPDGAAQTLYPVSGTYAISLPLATNRNMPGTTGGVAPDSTGSAPIGGSPRILVEYDPNAK
ncbi:MAG: hypothetical protein U0559_15035 [Anaerolineae bacterium]